jgi:hypothetical protein
MNQQDKNQRLQEVLTEYFKYRLKHPIVLINYEAAEKHYNASFIGDWALPLKSGNWSSPAAVFYCPEPDKSKGHSDYFAIVEKQSVISTPDKPDYQMYILSAAFIKYKVLTGAYSQFLNKSTNETELQVVYSCHVHDYVVTSNEEVMIDGGFDYVKTNTQNLFQFQFVEGLPVFLKDLNPIEETVKECV